MKPKTLQQAMKHFSNEQVCIDAVAALRWPNGAVCPTPDCKYAVYYMPTQRRWKCRTCKKQFSVKVGTIFEDSAIGLDKWLIALWLLVNCKNGISSYEVGRDLGLTQKSAWFVLHRLRLALQSGNLGKLGGRGKHIEADETFIGGAARFMHPERRKRMITERGVKDKTAVMGILERGGKVHATVLHSRRKHDVQGEIRKHVKAHSAIYTDALLSYQGLVHQDFAHEVVDHAEKYVDGQVHTNGLENFWSLVKRGLKGTYISVEPFHLFRYLDEQVYRFNNRGSEENPLNDADRFEMALEQVSGKRLTFAQVTGKDGKLSVA
jgi:transposase-like protein